MSKRLKLTIGWLYPDLMSTYGDRGNIIVLAKRCLWKGISAKVENVTLETPVSILKRCDVIFMGGAQDRQQKLAGEDFLKRKGPVIKSMVEDGIPGLFVCAAYQAIGHFYQPYQGDRIPGPGIFDLYTKHPGDQAKRLIGNVACEITAIKLSSYQEKSSVARWLGSSMARKTIVGFENHGGRTYLGKKLKSFAKVLKGYGNNGQDGYEGAIYKNAIGSYFHGPILTKNPHIADWLITRTLQVKYKQDFQLESLDDTLSWQAHDYMLRRMGLI